MKLSMDRPSSCWWLLCLVLPWLSAAASSTSVFAARRKRQLTSTSYIPRCTCKCCTVQTCNGIKTRHCPGGKEPTCLVERQDLAPGCDTWLDVNMVPVMCDVKDEWRRRKMNGDAPKSISHNEFCSKFCSPPLVAVNGAQCKNPDDAGDLPPVNPNLPANCCHCAHNIVTGLVQRDASNGTSCKCCDK
eukprot:gnl/TRDRNA2_/TRDRNA2_74472_c0_seq1.p1 gnl/TRDRNA2_/TRDRNA2_74472_c0~~gnl/TRDRNA2_/TRDRNA2_74472_c0_seq1.p1  ORF type:complete len:188 (+),score=16.77 gnl/TRDRNA2_/TRDRNA2_74472_c0_seq1:103-666(+)